MSAKKVKAPQGPPRVRLDRDERRRQIVESCANLIATRAYSNTGLRDIAADVGISTGTLLHHFRSKEELLVATLLAVSDDFMDHMRDAITRSRDPVRKLQLLVRAVFEAPRHDVGWRVWIAFWHEAALNPGLASLASGRTDIAESIIASVIQEGRDAGRLRSEDPALSAAELGALIDGVALRLYGESGRWSRRQALGVIDRLIGDWTIESPGPHHSTARGAYDEVVSKVVDRSRDSIKSRASH
jgi:AcrR family transcriptional regulator